MIHKPDNKVGGSIVAQDQAAAFTQDTVGTVKKVLGIWIMMKAVCTDNGIKRIILKGQIFTVTYKKFRVGEILGLGHMDHFRSKIQTGVVFIRIFLMKKFDHRAGSTATVQDIAERLFFQFGQDRRIIVLAHFVNTGMAAVIDFGCLRKFFDRKFFIFFRGHSNVSLILICC